MDSGSDRPGNGAIPGPTGCNGSFQHQHSPTNSAQDVHSNQSAKMTQNTKVQNHLQPQKNDLMWKSAENLCASGGGGPSTVQALAVSCGGIVTGSTSIVQGEGPNMRLVSSVSACPLGSNTSCSPAFSPNTNSLTPQHQHISTSLHFPSSPAFIPDACGPNGTSSPYAETRTTVGPIDELTSSSQSVHLPQLDGGEVRSSSPCSSPKASPRLILREASCDSSEDKLLQSDTIGSFSREGSLDQSFSDHLDQQPNEKLDSTSRSSESCRSLETGRSLGPDLGTNNGIPVKDRDRKESRDSKSSDKKSKKAWYSMLSPTYKSRSEDLKRLFKDLPSDERLIVDYSCALQKDILVHGRLYVTPNFFCFYSKIFGWETFLTIKCKDIVTMSKEKTALVIPNALQVNVDNEKHFFTSFTARDKTYLMLFRIWQNALMDQQMSPTELWQWVHSCYGDELGLTSDDDDYVAPSTEDDTKNMSCTDRESVTMTTPMKMYNVDSTEDASQVECSLDDGGLTRSEPPIAREPHYPVEPSSRSPAKSLHHTISPSKHSTGQPGGPGGTQSPDVIPTDLSDTTESEANNSIVAGEIVVCPNASSHHLGRELMNAVYTLPVDTVFTLIFANAKFMLDIYTARKTYDVVSSPWQSNSDTNQKLRQVTYTMTLPPNSFGPKVSHVTETQVVSPFSKPGEMYTVDVEACNAGIPYADSFYISNHWCLTRESSSETRVSVWTQVRYKKNVWGFMKGVIDKNAYIGIESLMQDMNAALLVEVDRSNQKRTRRRRRRAGSKVETADSTNPLQVEKGKDMHKSTQIPSRKMLTVPSACLETSAAPAEGPIRIVLLTLIGLLVVNALLYYRLWALEEKVNYPSSMHSFPALDPNIFRQGGGKGSWEDWVAILHQQEAQHSTEIERWRKSIEEAARFLKQAEEALQNLHASIPPHHASKIQSLLKQVQALQESQDESSPLHSTSLHSTPSSSSSSSSSSSKSSSKSSSSSHHSSHLHSQSHMYHGEETAETPEGIKVDWERKREL